MRHRHIALASEHCLWENGAFEGLHFFLIILAHSFFKNKNKSLPFVTFWPIVEAGVHSHIWSSLAAQGHTHPQVTHPAPHIDREGLPWNQAGMAQIFLKS